MQPNNWDNQRQAAEDEALFAMAKQAMRENDEEDFQAFLNSDAYVEPDEKKFEAFGKELEKRYLRKVRKGPFSHARLTWRRAVVFAAILAIILLSATVCAAHFGFLGWFSTDHSIYSSIWPDQGTRLEKPEGWDSPYYPTWMAGGYNFTEISPLASIKSLTYSSDTSSDKVVFTVREGTTWHFSNTENMDKTVVEIRGQNSVLYRTSDGCRGVLVLRVTDAIIIIDGPLIDEDFIKIAENIHGI